MWARSVQGAAAAAIVAVLCVGLVEAKDKPIEELPKDVLGLAFCWTEPVKQVARETRRFDPVSGLWFGLLEGSIKSVERTAELFLLKHNEPSDRAPASDKALLRYAF